MQEVQLTESLSPLACFKASPQAIRFGFRLPDSVLNNYFCVELWFSGKRNSGARLFPRMFWQSTSCCLSALACRAHAVLLSDGRGGESGEIRAESSTANTSSVSLALCQTSQKQYISAHSHHVFRANAELFVPFLLKAFFTKTSCVFRANELPAVGYLRSVSLMDDLHRV